ncbi:hypothetical protein CYPRO_2192 [Cyclonatronum proteinivorum]|uniref:Uncharacterized protein n=1 Tax=Cyclonatronum proteinivorum TaxID=1457365 RepID=A0A345ULT8_9BACT|nr:hypothetical protein CYPRO_2192 [Cyclonatronum proteinivorum]
MRRNMQSASIRETDRQLYHKFGLNPEEITVIEGMIKRMG